MIALKKKVKNKNPDLLSWQSTTSLLRRRRQTPVQNGLYGGLNQFNWKYFNLMPIEW